MRSLKGLKKQELLELMLQYKLTVSSKMTKDQIISTLESHIPQENTKPLKKSTTLLKDSSSGFNLIHPKKTPKPISKPKKSPPTKTITPSFDNNITVLVQSHDKALIIWHADPSEDPQIKAWKFKNEFGLDILVPNYARSIFIDLSILYALEFSLYKIHLDDSSMLFQTYQDHNFLLSNNNQPNNYQNLPKEDLQKIVDKHLNEYKQHVSSHQHFSSSQHFSSHQHFS
ncbi:MAG: hypothetical protein ACRC0X_08025 [Brevinema sp.]